MASLLDPISDAAPCGEDLSYDSVSNDLAVLFEGTPETQFSKAVEPNWPAIRKLSEQTLKRSKDLQIAIYYAVSLIQINGLEGAAEGVELIAGLVRQYWEGVYPQIDPDDNDPTQRLNILSQLTVEAGSYGDPIKFIDRLSAAPVFRLGGFGPVSLDYLKSEIKTDAGTVLGASKLPEMVVNANPEEMHAGVDNLRRVVNAVHALDDFLVQTLGSGTAPSFDTLIKAIDKGLRPFDALTAATEESTAAVAAPTEGGGSAFTPGAAAGPSISGEIRSQADVRQTLQKICNYYAAVEPSSPVPILLQRAQRLVGKSFLEVLNDLAPGGNSEMSVIIGPLPEEET